MMIEKIAYTQLCLIHSDYVLLMSQSNWWHKALWVIFIQGNIHGQSFKDILYSTLPNKHTIMLIIFCKIGNAVLLLLGAVW